MQSIFIEGIITGVALTMGIGLGIWVLVSVCGKKDPLIEEFYEDPAKFLRNYGPKSVIARETELDERQRTHSTPWHP